MKLKTVLGAAVTAALLTACGGGDVVLAPTNIDNSVDNSVVNSGGGNEFSADCGSYEKNGETFGGVLENGRCVYQSDFVSDTNPLTENVTLGPGVHVFNRSVLVGENVTIAAGDAAPVGPTLTIEAGATVAFQNSGDYMSIARGSKVEAVGTAAEPITITAVTDIDGNAGAEDVSLWGGLVINGLANTNECAGQTECNVESEGIPATYGGFDDADNSGTLEYVIVKHTGFEVAPGNELNGITFNTVGSGTTVNNLQTYSTFDDGIEFFGGSVDITNYVGMFTKDDTIDFSDGYLGTITNALVIQSETDGNRCIEGNNVGSGDTTLEPRSNPTITNFTCITSGHDSGTHGDAEGPIFREGAQFTLTNSFIVNPSQSVASNECLELDDSDTAQIAQDGGSAVTNTVIVCSEPVKGALPNGTTALAWVEGQTGNVVVAADEFAPVVALDGMEIAPSIVDETGATVLADTTGIGAQTDDLSWAFGLDRIWW